MNLIEITDRTTKKQVVKGFKKLGAGAFTECFALSEDQVLLVTIDPLKEVYSMGWLNNPLFPVTERVDCLSSGETLYKMERYTKVSSLKNNLDADQYEIYKTLRKAFDDMTYEVVNNRNIYNGYNIVYKTFEKIENEELRQVMIEALDDIANYGSDIGFEISPRNVAVKDGKLILLDCFYMRSTLQEVRNSK